jgi:ABC-type nitrate/sulfonate/bicarbonate transport system ATPase subunit
MTAQFMIRVDQLNKSFGSHRVIDDLSFSLAEGERTALFAPSGAGKTTLIRILTGVEKADSGRFTLMDAEPVTLFQEPRLFPFLTVEENIFLPFKIKGKNVTNEVQRRYERWLEVCELSDSRRYYPYQLSGGMRQKTALVRGLLGEPRLLMMDEPFQSISAGSKQNIIAHIRQTLPDSSILFVTHIAEEIPMLAQTVLLFKNTLLSCPERVSAADLQKEISISNSLFITNENNRTSALNVTNKEIL